MVELVRLANLTPHQLRVVASRASGRLALRAWSVLVLIEVSMTAADVVDDPAFQLPVFRRQNK
jgi:hypothetical protein